MCFFVLLLGCGRRAHDRHEVRGQVTFDGKPLPAGLIIRFTPQEPEKPSGVGTTDSQGRYFVYGEPGKIGLNPGVYRVSVELPLADLPGPYTGPPELANITIPLGYRTSHSKLTFTAPQDGPTFDIAVVSEKK